MSGLLSYSGLTTKIRAMQSHLLNDQNFREIVELESVPQAVSYLKQHKGYEDLFEGYNEADLHRGQIEKMLRLTVYRDFSKLYRFANVEQRKFLALYFKRYEVSVIKECLNTVFDHRDVVLNLSIFDGGSVRLPAMPGRAVVLGIEPLRVSPLTGFHRPLPAVG